MCASSNNREGSSREGSSREGSDRGQGPNSQQRRQRDFTRERAMQADQRQRLELEKQADKAQDLHRAGRADKLRDSFIEDNRGVAGFIGKIENFPERERQGFARETQTYQRLQQAFSDVFADADEVANRVKDGTGKRSGRSGRNAAESILREAAGQIHRLHQRLKEQVPLAELQIVRDQLANSNTEALEVDLAQVKSELEGARTDNQKILRQNRTLVRQLELAGHDSPVLAQQDKTLKEQLDSTIQENELLKEQLDSAKQQNRELAGRIKMHEAHQDKFSKLENLLERGREQAKREFIEAAKDETIEFMDSHDQRISAVTSYISDSVPDVQGMQATNDQFNEKMASTLEQAFEYHTEIRELEQGLNQSNERYRNKRNEVETCITGSQDLQQELYDEFEQRDRIYLDQGKTPDFEKRVKDFNETFTQKISRQLSGARLEDLNVLLKNLNALLKDLAQSRMDVLDKRRDLNEKKEDIQQLDHDIHNSLLQEAQRRGPQPEQLKLDILRTLDLKKEREAQKMLNKYFRGIDDVISKADNTRSEEIKILNEELRRNIENAEREHAP